MSQFLSGLTRTGGLLRVKSLIALTLTGGFVWGFVDGVVPPEVFSPVVVGAVGTYFGSSIARAANGGGS